MSAQDFLAAQDSKRRLEDLACAQVLLIHGLGAYSHEQRLELVRRQVGGAGRVLGDGVGAARPRGLAGHRAGSFAPDRLGAGELARGAPAPAGPEPGGHTHRVGPARGEGGGA